jgi:hypothetical protein
MALFAPSSCSDASPKMSLSSSVPCSKILVMKGFYAVLLLHGYIAAAGTLDHLEGSVFMLRGALPVKETVNNQAAEVWWKFPGSTNFVQKTERRGGTGVFVFGKRLTYMVTASHVAAECLLAPVLIFRGAKGAQSLALQDLQTALEPAPGWYFHKKADVAIFPVLPKAGPLRDSLTNIVHLKLSELSVETNAPSRDVPLTTLGFALGFGVGEGFFSPLSSVSKPSSSTLINENGVRYFLLQAPSVDGYSGAPVFYTGELFVRGNVLAPEPLVLRCHGTISATVPDQSGGKMAVVIPSFYIAELITEFEAASKFKIVP